jgi:signal transduction histidine kinase
MAQRALRRANYLQTLIDDLLDLAAEKTGLKNGETVEIIDLVSIVEKVLNRYAIPAEEKNIHIQNDIEPNQDFNVEANTIDIDRAITNIVSNAIKYTPENGNINIRLTNSDNIAEIAITDTGIGIPEEALPHLFEEFYRAPNAKAQIKEGTGLGLIITKDIVTRYGGTIRVSSREGEGSTFTILLPLTEEQKTDTE